MVNTKKRRNRRHRRLTMRGGVPLPDESKSWTVAQWCNYIKDPTTTDEEASKAVRKASAKYRDSVQVFSECRGKRKSSEDDSAERQREGIVQGAREREYRIQQIRELNPNLTENEARAMEKEAFIETEYQRLHSVGREDTKQQVKEYVNKDYANFDAYERSTQPAPPPPQPRTTSAPPPQPRPAPPPFRPSTPSPPPSTAPPPKTREQREREAQEREQQRFEQQRREQEEQARQARQAAEAEAARQAAETARQAQAAEARRQVEQQVIGRDSDFRHAIDIGDLEHAKLVLNQMIRLVNDNNLGDYYPARIATLRSQYLTAKAAADATARQREEEARQAQAARQADEEARDAVPKMVLDDYIGVINNNLAANNIQGASEYLDQLNNFESQLQAERPDFTAKYGYYGPRIATVRNRVRAAEAAAEAALREQAPMEDADVLPRRTSSTSTGWAANYARSQGPRSRRPGRRGGKKSRKQKRIN